MVLLDFDYVVEILMENDDDHVDLRLDLVSICLNEVVVDVHLHFHYFLKEIVWIFYKCPFLR